jgi:uncharacterized protein (DUF305 family)
MHYQHLVLMAALAFIAMYVLMYAMVDVFGNVYNNVNQLYMAALMTAPMLVIDLLVMRAMYPDPRLNALVMGASILIGVGSWVAIRQQLAVNDAQFLRSMIPHHAGAMLMCRKAPLTNPEIKNLCDDIIAGQQAEIAQMKAILERED